MATQDEEGLKKLEYLSLVSKVCDELQSHGGLGDKVVAEFITELGRRCETVDEFDAELKKNGANMPDYFVRTLLTIIHAILPPKPKGKSEKESKDVKKDSDVKYPALAIADSRDRAKQLEKELAIEAQSRLEDEEREKEKERERARRERHRDRDRYNKDRDHRGDNYDEYDRSRRRDRDQGRDHDRRNRHSRDEDDGEDNMRSGGDRGRSGGNRRYGHSDEPELYMVYRGRVSRVMDTGCFVQLNDFRGKEGLVHVSQIASRNWEC